MGGSNVFYSQIALNRFPIILADANNFFVSCERVFDPKANKTPAVVLSNNDGCVVARSAEIKKLGIPIGIPYFKIKDQLNKIHTKVYSSNYQLYADMSRRMMSILKKHLKTVEIYSVDEAFGTLSEENHLLITSQIIEEVFSSTGIPLSLGIAPTKTLAKVATDVAKKASSQVFSIYNVENDLKDEILDSLEVNDIWGIGYRTTEKLNKLGIRTALTLKRQNPKEMRGLFGLGIYKTILELNDVRAIPFNETLPLQKGLSYTRSFSTFVSEKDQLLGILIQHTSNAVQKLRSMGGVAGEILVFAHAGRHAKVKYYKEVKNNLGENTDDTFKFVNAVTKSIDTIFKKGIKYKKAGVWLGKIQYKSSKQLNIFDLINNGKGDKISQVVDQINTRWGLDTLTLAPTLNNLPFKSKRELMSKRYTTNWDELIRLK